MADLATKEVVNRAVDNSKKFHKEVFASLLESRLAGHHGYHYDGITSVDELEQAIREANWVPTEYPGVHPWNKVYKTKDISGGHWGMVKIEYLRDAEQLTLVEDADGMVATIPDLNGTSVSYTFLIIGSFEGKQMVFDLIPGAPFKAVVPKEFCPPEGSVISRAEALKLGFNYAKIV